jgi:hypothetical protein
MNAPILDLRIHNRQIEAELKPVQENIIAKGVLIDGPEIIDCEGEFAAFPSTLSTLSW